RHAGQRRAGRARARHPALPARARGSSAWGRGAAGAPQPVFAPGAAWPERRDIRLLPRPRLAELASVTRETATLSVPGEHEATTLDFVQSPLSVRSVAEVGRISAAHATAVGKVFLAHGGTPPTGSLAAYTERTIVDPAVLEVEVARARDRGWAEAVGEREEDLNAIAAPVVSPAGSLVAIIGVQGPAVRFSPRAMRSAAELLLERAALISATL